MKPQEIALAVRSIRRNAAAAASHAVVPIGVIQSPVGEALPEDTKFLMLGTAFCVHSHGVFVTAGHVLRDCYNVSRTHAPGAVAVLFRGLRGGDETGVRYTPNLDRPCLQSALVTDALFASGPDEEESTQWLDTDLVVLRASRPLVTAEYESAVLALGDSCDIGDEVVGCGYPFPRDVAREHGDTLYLPSLVSGLVSTLMPNPAAPPEQHMAIRLHMFAAIGMSGGPVVDAYSGAVVGVIRDGITDAPDADDARSRLIGNTGISRAIPVHFVRTLLEQFCRKERLPYPEQAPND